MGVCFFVANLDIKRKLMNNLSSFPVNDVFQ